MPNIKSAKKRVKIIAVKTLRNKAAKSAYRTTLKKFDSAAAAGDKEAMAAAYKTTVKCVDKAVAKGIIHKNAAARKKSQIDRKMAQ